MARPDPPFERYEGLTWTAEPEDSDWRLAEPHETCRQPKCRRPAVVMLLRTRSHYRNPKPPTTYWWGCCQYHTYGRWIEDGQVWHWALRATEATDVAP